jgi:polar amino acid transport system substrate-binding protein
MGSGILGVLFLIIINAGATDMQRFFTTGVLASCLLGLAASPAMAAGKPTIPLCFEREEVLPWRTLDGGGLNFELLNEVARRTGVQFDFQSMPWKRCLAQLKANQVGGAFAVSFSQERLALGAYPGGLKPDPERRLHVDRYLLVRRKGSRVDWNGKAFQNLDGRIGFQLGYSVGDFLRSQGVLVDEGSQRSDELLQKLLSGRVEAAALGGGDATRLVRGRLAEQLEVLPAPLIEKPYYLMLSHDFVARQPQLAERIWNTVLEVRTSPAYGKRERELSVVPQPRTGSAHGGTRH